MNCRGIDAALDAVLEDEPVAALARDRPRARHARTGPVPPRCSHVPVVALHGARERRAIRDARAARASRRTRCSFASRSTATSRCSWPMPASRVCPVSASVSRRSDGSAATMRPSASRSLSRSARRLRLDRDAHHRFGRHDRLEHDRVRRIGQRLAAGRGRAEERTDLAGRRARRLRPARPQRAARAGRCAASCRVRSRARSAHARARHCRRARTSAGRDHRTRP